MTGPCRPTAHPRRHPRRHRSPASAMRRTWSSVLPAGVAALRAWQHPDHIEPLCGRGARSLVRRGRHRGRRPTAAPQPRAGDQRRELPAAREALRRRAGRSRLVASKRIVSVRGCRGAGPECPFRFVNGCHRCVARDGSPVRFPVSPSLRGSFMSQGRQFRAAIGRGSLCRSTTRTYRSGLSGGEVLSEDGRHFLYGTPEACAAESLCKASIRGSRDQASLDEIPERVLRSERGDAQRRVVSGTVLGESGLPREEVAPLLAATQCSNIVHGLSCVIATGTENPARSARTPPADHVPVRRVAGFGLLSRLARRIDRR